MKGKKPMERNSYMLRMEDGTLVEVSREIYLEWYQSRRRERYQKEKDRKHGISNIDELEERGNCLSMPFCIQNEVEETALRNICRDNVRKALEKLPVADARLMELLYFKSATVTDAAKIYGCSRRTIQNRRKRILAELCQILHEQGIEGGYF